MTSTTEEFIPATQSELARFVAENAQGPRRPLQPVGGRTGLHFGLPVQGAPQTVSLQRLDGVIDYPARDMTITVAAGMRLENLRQILHAEGQRLPVDIPQAHRATLGGALATNVSGPRQFAWGTLRDWVIGMAAVDGQGRLFHAGGRVVKNVAGYDLCKLLIGSLGTLAIITQVTLKVAPQPEACGMVWATFDSPAEIDAVLERLLTSEARPVALEFLNPPAGREIAAESRCELPADRVVLAVAVEGTGESVAWQMDRLKREIAPFGPDELLALESAEAARVLDALVEFRTRSNGPLAFEARLRPSRLCRCLEKAMERPIALQAHAGNGVVIGHVSDEVTGFEAAERLVGELRQEAAEADGHLILLDAFDDWKCRLGVFGRPHPSWSLMRRLKQALDPWDVLNPGRFEPANRVDATAATS